MCVFAVLEIECTELYSFACFVLKKGLTKSLNYRLDSFVYLFVCVFL